MYKINLVSVVLALSVAVLSIHSTHGAPIIGDDCLCTLEYKPICGTDGETYSNECFFRCATESDEGKRSNLKIKFQGSCDDKKNFDCFCTREYLPICATNDVTYSNKCNFECAVKSVEGKQHNLKFKHDGECKEAKNLIEEPKHPQILDDCFCTEEYRPVCGSDGFTYSNKCFFKCAQRSTEGQKKNLLLKHDGECKSGESEDEEERMSCPCARNFFPICGSNGKTYSNECNFKCAQENKKQLKIKHFGECDESDEDVCYCTREYLPICGTDNYTYSNECSFKCMQKKKRNLKIKFFGQCIE